MFGTERERVTVSPQLEHRMVEARLEKPARSPRRALLGKLQSGGAWDPYLWCRVRLTCGVCVSLSRSWVCESSSMQHQSTWT